MPVAMPMRNGKAQSGAFADFARGKERLENPCARGRVHAVPGIADLEHHIITWGDTLIGAFVPQFDAHGKRAAARAASPGRR